MQLPYNAEFGYTLVVDTNKKPLRCLIWHTRIGTEDIGTEDIGTEEEAAVGGNLGIYDWANPNNWRRLYGQGKRFVEDVKSNWDYWQTQIPYYGDYLNAQETKQFWADYKKNTGFSPRYPRRAYGSQGTTAIYSASRMFRNFKRLYG